MNDRRFYEVAGTSARRSAPSALRNRGPISEVLRDWLPDTGFVLEIASGSGEHVVYFAEQFSAIEWQPSDIHPDALASISEWRQASGLKNVREPIALDASSSKWPVDRAGAISLVKSGLGDHSNNTGQSGGWDVVLNFKMDSDSCDEQETTENCGFDVVLNLNMVHISPWTAALGLLDGAARVLKRGGALILYGPWLQTGVQTAPSNLAFDQQLRERDPEWGLRRVEDFDVAASERGFALEQTHAMPANNLMLLFRLDG